MKAMLVLIFVVLTAATVVAYGVADAAASIAAAVSQSAQADEPMTLLLSGSALIALGGALRRLTV